MHPIRVAPISMRIVCGAYRTRDSGDHAEECTCEFVNTVASAQLVATGKRTISSGARWRTASRDASASCRS
jgi:hypothetical protein